MKMTLDISLGKDVVYSKNGIHMVHLICRREGDCRSHIVLMPFDENLGVVPDELSSKKAFMLF